MANNIPPFIDSSGNMHLHAREGGVAVLTFKDANGDSRDVSASEMFFEVAGFRKALEPHDTDDDKQVLIIERGELNSYLNKISEYVILDETGLVPEVIIGGRVAIVGWV